MRRAPLSQAGALLLGAIGAHVAVDGVAASGAAPVARAAKSAPAYCNIPSSSNPSWAFRVGAPIVRATGSYAHGHGTLSGVSASGVICQVDRAKGASDRQIILSVEDPIVSHVGRTTYQGHLANKLAIHVRVKSSTDAKCAIGTVGTLTMIATYNGVKDDEVVFAFPKACADHDHAYTGSNVVALVPV